MFKYVINRYSHTVVHFSTGLLIPADSRIHSDQAWVDENIPYELRLVQFVFENENVLTKEVLLGVCSFS